MRPTFRYALAIPLALLSGCFGMCGPSGPSPEASCVDDPAPSGGRPAIVLGSSEDGDFERLSSGQLLPLDYGNQGGQHFYYSIKAYGADSDALIFVTFFRDGLDPIDGGGGAGGDGGGAGGSGGVAGGGGGVEGSGGGAASSTSSSGSGGGGEGLEGSTPGDLVFLSEFFESGDCEDEWFQIDNLYVQVPDAVDTSGLLRAQLGRCSASGCPFDARGNYVPEEVLATAEVRIGYTP